jgi:hypothetical protein
MVPPPPFEKLTACNSLRYEQPIMSMVTAVQQNNQTSSISLNLRTWNTGLAPVGSSGTQHTSSTDSALILGSLIFLLQTKPVHGPYFLPLQRNNKEDQVIVFAVDLRNIRKYQLMKINVLQQCSQTFIICSLQGLEPEFIYLVPIME